MPEELIDTLQCPVCGNSHIELWPQGGPITRDTTNTEDIVLDLLECRVCGCEFYMESKEEDKVK